MLTDVLKALIQNSTILVVAFLFITKFSRWKLLENRLKRTLIQGIAYALCGVIVLMFSVEVLPGVLIDMRTPVLVTAAFTGGALAGAIALFPLLLYRILIGGTGVYAGIGIIVSAFLFGLILRTVEKRFSRHAGPLFQLVTGFGSAVIYYLWILILPGGIAFTVLKETFIPLTVASVISILAIFFIRKREAAHQDLLDRLSEINDLFEEISLDENIGITVVQGSRIAFINSSLLKKFGFASFNPGNRNLLRIVSPKSRDQLRVFFRSVENDEQTDVKPIEITIPGKTTLTLLAHARKMIYRGIPSILIISVDISEQVFAQETLEKRVNQLQLSLDSSGAVLWRAMLKEDRLFADGDLYELLHYHPVENPPLFSHWLLRFSMPPEMKEDFRIILQGKKDSIFGEMSFKGEDLKTRWFNTGARITRVDSDGLPVELTGILFETTEIKVKELELMAKEIEDLQSQKMETIGRLAGGVAHDFNNLLHVIMGYAEILKKAAIHDPDTRELAEPILSASLKGRDLVRQLLLFSSDKVPELQPVNLEEITEGFLNLLSRIIEENIAIRSSLDSSVPDILGDRGQIEQMLMNLCINSRDAMPGGGSMNIALSSTSYSRQHKTVTGTIQPGEYVQLSVSDTGPGIPENRHRSIFEPFYTTKQVNKGTGLGLATVLGIMEAHSGFIDVCNIPEGGLRITLFFPVTAVHSSETPSVAESLETRLDTASLTVLVAEDDPQVMNLTVEGLKAHGATVLTAVNGKEAIKVFIEHQSEIDVLVFDVVMPEMNGPDACREIRSIGGTVPVVFTTGYAGRNMTGLGGDYEIITKPYAVQELLLTIGRLTQNSGENP